MEISEREIKENDKPDYLLQLFVTGASPISVRAINNLQKILEQHLKGKYELQIIDIHQQSDLLRDNDISAVPVLVKKLPLPERRMVGDMSETDRVLRGLGLK